MSYFAGSSWRNAATNALAQATTTTENVSVSRQGSTDESLSGAPGERKPLLRSQTDPLVKLAAQNGSRTSLSTTEVDPAAGRRFTLRGVARALPYFLRAAPTATTVTEEPERTQLSSSPPQESIIDLTPKAPVKRSTLAQEVLPPVENGSDDLESPLSEGRTESVESPEEEPVHGRKSTSSSTGSTIVTEEPLPMSSNLDDDLLSDVKKQAGIRLDYSSLHNRVRELEKENEEKMSRLRLAQEAEARERGDRERIQAEMTSQRTEIDRLRLSLKSSQGQSRESEEKTISLEREMTALRGRIATQDATSKGNDTLLRDLVAERDGLKGNVAQLEMRITETERGAKDLRTQISRLESEKQIVEKSRANLEAETTKTRNASEKALSDLTATYKKNALQAKNTIDDLSAKLSTSTTKINQLETSLVSSSRAADGLSKTVDVRTADVHRLEQLVSDLQASQRNLEEKIGEQASQMKRAEETSKAQRLELCQKHTLDIDTERRIVRNLQSSLESLQLEMGVTEGKVVTLTREKSSLLDKIGKLEVRCKGGEQQVEGLKADLGKANASICDLEEKSKIEREEAKKERETLINQSNHLGRQRDGAQKQSAERLEQIQRLEATKNDLTNTLRRTQTSVTEKDSTIHELERQNASLEAGKVDLEKRLRDVEGTLVDAREMAQSVLDKTKQAHDREMAQAKARIQELQDQLSSFITTAQQLHSSLETSLAETEKAQKMVDDQSQEIRKLEQHIATLQDAVRSLGTENEETLSQMKSKEQAARDAKAAILRSHTAEIDAQRRMAQGLKEDLERVLKEKEKEVGSLVSENGTLRAEVSAAKQQSLKNEEDINAAHATLRDITERNKTSIERLEDEKAKVDEEVERLRSKAETLEQELRVRGTEIEKLKATTFQKIGSAVSSAFGGLWSLVGVSNAVAASHPGSILAQAH